MWKREKLLQSVPKLRQTMSEGFARILFVKTKGPMVIREAIATTNLKYVPLDQMPKGTKYGLIGWSEFVPMEGVESYPEPIAYEEEPIPEDE